MFLGEIHYTAGRGSTRVKNNQLQVQETKNEIETNGGIGRSFVCINVQRPGNRTGQ
jgi:hypothetical protein